MLTNFHYMYVRIALSNASGAVLMVAETQESTEWTATSCQFYTFSDTFQVYHLRI